MPRPIIETRCPFSQPRFAGLVWRATTFSPEAPPILHWGDGLALALPDDLRRAVPKRQAEFLAGRLCAALALQALVLPADVPRCGRAPVWPDGAAGSITHNDNWAAAVVSKDHLALGLDCETVMDGARAHDLCDRILSPAEIALRPASFDFARFVTLAFSAKEAFYKAVSGRVGRVLEFHEVRLTGLSPDSLTLRFEGRGHCVNWLIDGPRCLTLYGEATRPAV